MTKRDKKFNFLAIKRPYLTLHIHSFLHNNESVIYGSSIQNQFPRSSDYFNQNVVLATTLWCFLI